MRLHSIFNGLMKPNIYKSIILFIVLVSISVYGQAGSENKSINKKYPDAPAVKSISIYEINSEDTIGTIMSLEIFNQKGLKTKHIEYDYNGVEKAKENFEYDEDGKVIKISAEGKTSTFSYNEKGLIGTIDSEELIIEFLYNEKNHIAEMKYKQKDEYVGYQRFEYKYDDKDSVIETKKFDKFIDEPGETLQYHKSMKYDDAGNLIEEIHYFKGEPESSEVNKYDEYGSLIKKQIYEWPDRLQSMNKYKYDDYGNLILVMYEEDGSIWGERYVYEYAD